MVGSGGGGRERRGEVKWLDGGGGSMVGVEIASGLGEYGHVLGA